MSERGIKFDGEKPDYSLVPPFAMEELARLLTVGAKKYSPNNWQKVKPKKRYYAAAGRHLFQYMSAVLRGKKSEQYDDETGIHHLICVACNVMFLYEHETVYSVDEPFYGDDSVKEKTGLPKIDPSNIDPKKVDELAKEIARKQLERELFPNRSPSIIPNDRFFNPIAPPYEIGDFPHYTRPYSQQFQGTWCSSPIDCLTVKDTSDIISQLDLKTKQ